MNYYRPLVLVSAALFCLFVSLFPILPPVKAADMGGCIRQQEFIFHLVRAMNLEAALPEDAGVKDYISLLESKGITIPGGYRPDEFITSKQIAVMLIPAMGLDKSRFEKIKEKIGLSYKNKAIIINIKGDVQVRIKETGRWKHARPGFWLNKEDIIRTNEKSSAILRLGEISVVAVKENTTVSIYELAKNPVIYLKEGSITLDTGPLPKKTKHYIITPTTVAAVRGTIIQKKYMEGITTGTLARGKNVTKYYKPKLNVNKMVELIKEDKLFTTLGRGIELKEGFYNLNDKIFRADRQEILNIIAEAQVARTFAIEGPSAVQFLIEEGIWEKEPSPGEVDETLEETFEKQAAKGETAMPAEGAAAINIPVPSTNLDTGASNEESVNGTGSGPVAAAQAAAASSTQVTIQPPQPTAVTTTGDVFYVNAQTGDDNNDGSEDSPWKTIAYAIATVTGTDIIASGTFTDATEASGDPNGFPIKFNNSSKQIRIIGGTFDGESTNQIFEAFNSAGHIVFSGATFINGNNGANNGGAIYVDNSRVSFESCNFSNNQTSGFGGVIYALNSADVAISNCNFSNNRTGNGGAVQLAVGSTLTDSFTFDSTTFSNSLSPGNRFTSNSGNAGGAIFAGDSTLNLVNGSYAFTSNTSTGATGGAIHCDTCTINLSGATLTANIGGEGGSIYLLNSLGEINRSKFDSNHATADGGAISEERSSVDLVNCLIVNNSADANGGDIFLLDSSSPRIMNCTFDSGTAGADGDSIAMNANSSPTIVNSIFTLNHGVMIYIMDAGGSNPTINNCCIYDIDGLNLPGHEIAYNANVAAAGFVDDINGAWGLGSNNIGTESLSISGIPDYKADGSFRLQNTSVCIDAGTATGAPAIDFDGNPRPFGSGFDMGCYENQGTDPAVTGRVYDSVTGDTISSPIVAIYKSGTTTALSTTTDNPYTFNVDPGSYFIAISKSGYGYPSQIVSAVTPGDHGDIFTVTTSPLTIDIPMDPDGWLSVEKTVNKKKAIAGELVTYNIKIQNKHWYQSVDNVELVDEIVNGFKYIEDSAIGRRPSAVSGHKIYFNLGTVGANSTVNISYQVRVGTGIPPGRYKAAASTRKSTTKSINSNISSAGIRVVEDPLFTRGTIIGKVFRDENGNGVQDQRSEAGIPGVKIYTEYGVAAETDKDGKYHIADVPAGNHLLKVDLSSLPQYISDDTQYEFTTENPYFVKITEGLLAKVNFGVLLAKSQRPKCKDQFFLVALGEGTVRNLTASGNIEMADKDDRYDDGVHVDGRLAFYLKGKVLGKFLVTASVDTERLPGRKYRTKDLFTNLDPDKYYPVYGDASKVDYNGVDTQDIAYVLIEWDESFAKWGSFHTEFPYNLYTRTLSGGIVNYVSSGKTKFGDPWTVVNGFGAVSRQKPAHDEFVGTGGSLYYLKHTDIIEGSEKVRVEIRDRISKSSISSIPLAEEKDYEIDYEQGRILLKKPLNSVRQDYNSSIISNDILMGERVYLIIDYEYLSDGLSNNAWGMRASQQIGHHIRIGGSYIQEQKQGPDYELVSGDATLKLNKDTSINAFYARSEETQLGSNISFDGGLNFNSQLDTFCQGQKGEGYNIDGTTKLFNNTDVYLSYSKYDPYFSSSGSVSRQGTEKFIGIITSRLTKQLTLGLSHTTSKILKEATPIETLGARDTYVTTGIADFRRGKWDIRAEYQHQEVKNPVSTYSYFGTMPLLGNDFAAVRIGCQLSKWLYTYVRGQATVRGIANNQGTIGSDIELLDNTRINLAETTGNQGNSTLVGLDTKVTEGTDVYANIEVGNHIMLGRYTKTTYGQSTKLSPDSKAYVEEDYSSYRENAVRGTLIGYENKITDTLGIGLTYERSNLENNSHAIDRDTGSISLSYLNTDWLKIYTKEEVRNDIGTTETRQWLTENDILWRATKDITLSGRGNFAWTADKTIDMDEAESYDLGAGFSLRPVNWDRLSILGKYSYLTNLPPDSQWDFVELTKSRRHVYAIEGAFDLTSWVQIVGKFAYRDMQEKTGLREWTDSDTYLYLGRINLHIVKAWDIAAEYRTLANTQIEDAKKGWLIEIDRDIGGYMRLGAGYNFTDYDDDLRNDDNWDAKGWFLRVNGKY